MGEIADTANMDAFGHVHRAALKVQAPLRGRKHFVGSDSLDI